MCVVLFAVLCLDFGGGTGGGTGGVLAAAPRRLRSSFVQAQAPAPALLTRAQAIQSDEAWEAYRAREHEHSSSSTGSNEPDADGSSSSSSTGRGGGDRESSSSTAGHSRRDHSSSSSGDARPHHPSSTGGSGGNDTLRCELCTAGCAADHFTQCNGGAECRCAKPVCEPYCPSCQASAACTCDHGIRDVDM